jgi:radical SAM superfamily enzyme YgiQ (UPF0313 family)
MYDNKALGLSAVANCLRGAGHAVTMIHFKLPVIESSQADYMSKPTHYETINTSDPFFSIRRYFYDAKPWVADDLNALSKLLQTLDPSVVGLSTRSALDNHIDSFLKGVRKGSPKATIVAGGFGPTFSPDVYFPHVDYICVGEGEEVMLDLVNAVDGGTSPDGISGLMYHRDGKVVRNELPCYPEEHYFFNFATTSIEHFVIENGECITADIMLQTVKLEYSGSNQYCTMLGRGCLFDCSYCCAGKQTNLYKDQGSFSKRRLRKMDEVLAELEFAKNYGMRNIVFLDSFLSAPTDYLIEFFKKYKERVGLPFFAQLFPPQVLKHPELLSAAVDAGMDFIVVGLQSGSDRINKTIFNRPLANKVNIEFSEMLQQFPSVMIQYHFITHNPFVDEEAFKESLDTISRLPRKNSHFIFGRLEPFAGTEIDERIKRASPSELLVNRATMDKRALYYLLRYLLDDDAFLALLNRFDKMTFESLREIARKHWPVNRDANNPVVELGNVGLDLYEGRRGMFNERYSEALDAWQRNPNPRSMANLNQLFSQNVASLDYPQIAEQQCIELSQPFLGYGWGNVHKNDLGQSWRWMAPGNGNTLFLKLPKRGKILVRTHIHTATGDSIFKIRAWFDGNAPSDQRIVHENGAFFHIFSLKSPSQKQDKLIELRYGIDDPKFDKLSRSVGMTKVELETA